MKKLNIQLNKPIGLKKHSIFRDIKNYYQLLLMVLPGIAVLILFHYVPMFGILIAFKDYKFITGIIGSDWVGLDHFNRLFIQQNFGHIVYNTLNISLLKLLLGLPAPIILALLLNELRLQKLKSFLQTCLYLPHFFSWVVLAGIFHMVFSNTGPVNVILLNLGASDSLDFFGNGSLFRSMIIYTSVWQSMGWGAIIYLAALSGVDESLYEAAYMDGANLLRRIWHVSIPSIIPTIITVFILNLGNVLNAGYDQIYNMYNPTLYDVADIIDTYVIRALRFMDYGLGTAAELFKSVIGLILILVTNKLTNHFSDNELGIM